MNGDQGTGAAGTHPSPDLREAPIVALLNQQLADLIDLHSQTRQACWNIQRTGSRRLHRLFDDLALTIGAHIDGIALRVSALGGLALGTVRLSAGTSRLPDLPAASIDGRLCLATLAERYARADKSIRAAIAAALERQDADTASVLTEVSRCLDKALWFLEASPPDENVAS